MVNGAFLIYKVKFIWKLKKMKLTRKTIFGFDKWM